MPIQPPGQPIIPPQPLKKGADKSESLQKQPAPPRGESIGRGPEFDAHAVAVRMAALAHEAKQKELSFDEIVQKVIEETGLVNPQAAMEEANKKLQEEIEQTLEQIKQNKDLMEEAQAWQDFAEVLEGKLSEEQVTNILTSIEEEIKSN